MRNILRTLFGSKSDKDVKAMRPIVDEINRIFQDLHSLTDDELKSKTTEFKQKINEAVDPLIREEESIREQLRTDTVLSHEQRTDLHAKLEQNGKEQHEVIQQTLDEILPEAYAVVKEACRRLVGTHYMVVGNDTTWDMVPYDVQLMGGIALHQGKISEMATGEGKTLVATLPLYLNSLPGRGVHLITVNDYLARRDREWMLPLFTMLGVETDVIQSNMPPQTRKPAYNADITYGTNNEFGFDYLRDNMVTTADDMVQRSHWFAIVDEVDSVLVDEARTPLIISGPVSSGSTEKAFVDMVPRVRRLVEVQTRFINTIVAEAEKLLATGKKEDREQGGVNLLRAYRGIPKHGRLTKMLQDPDAMKLMRDTELEYLKDQGTRMSIIDDELFFTVDERNHSIDISEKGRELLANAQEDVNMFVIPDIALQMSELEGNTSLSAEDRAKTRNELLLVFSERSERIHIINQLLRAYTLYVRDDEYVVQDGKIKIVDEFTGRILEGRRYSDGLHQAIEAKEGVVVEQDTQTFATVTLQNYFRLYRKLSGMTGTAETEAAEFWEIYKLDVVVIPTNKHIIRKDLDDLIYRTKREKYNAVVEAVRTHLEANRAILVGTTSVEVSELLSKMLKRAGIQHNVLNAKQHQREAEIVAHAGRRGSVTIATNMAGRGTDIKLEPSVKEAGGLVIIGTERHDSRRIDRQLRGRAGRQGDPGISQFFISLEDDLMRLFQGERIASIMTRFKVPEGEPIQSPLITKTVENAQKKVEGNNFAVRKRLLEYDDVMNQQREVIYDRRRHALQGDRLKSEIMSYVQEYISDLYNTHYEAKSHTGFINELRSSLLVDPPITADDFDKKSKENIVSIAYDTASEFYRQKEESLGSTFMVALERYAFLSTIDEQWREHLRDMDDLKEGIYLRAYGQKDPLLEYKAEAYNTFMDLIKEINKGTIQVAFKYFPRVVEQPDDSQTKKQTADVPKVRSTISASRPLQFTHSSATPYAAADNGSASDQQPAVTNTIRNEARIYGRNEPCPVYPGRKFKNCCGAEGHRTCVKVGATPTKGNG
ncbi:MAG: preprotein translocase subunit SecA [Flavobacteriales bacterium]|nr:MAG: preprotein translocase subunit SecA [Bacteroidota bacterium]KXK35011.1 MAG: preprotein translocase subunit SecA [Chlorobi bacterium OLB6]MBE2266493.1 preprotein translocase subunit SecA [Flavobacteriales bacterium]MBV6464050.1 Protein translocase subunit SecA [Chlorobiota bacterium]MBW7853747.1 preprotein translocase subunit SecA [Candidatus Kapabacteria bacterium]MCC6331539.1 preprotein translocase subunit SecA [Ignavibacteria bacterium]